MKQTLTEKILSSRASRDVKAGDVVFAEVDWALVQDGTGPLTMDVIEEMGRGVSSPGNRVVFLDHASPSSRWELSASHIKLRSCAEKYSMKLFDVGDGVCHQIMAEKFVQPGQVVVGADSHTCTAGAFGAFASGYGSTDIAFAFSTGKIWLKVPESIKVELAGKLPPFASAKDIILELIGRLGASGATYKALEFCGGGLETLSMESRLTVCNMVIEAGAKNGIMPADGEVAAYMEEQRGTSVSFETLLPDDGASYESTLSIDLGSISPLAAAPHSVDNVSPVSDMEKDRISVDQVLLGTCTGGRLEDLRAAARVLEKRKIARGVRFIVTPASRRVYLDALREGLVETFIESGGTVVTPGCGPCVGIQGGVLGPGEVCLSTANRNFKGRMGCGESFIYLASPSTAAASAVKGYIASPEEFFTDSR